MEIMLDHIHPYIWQWDKNHRIIIKNGEADVEVHFANGLVGQVALVTMSYEENGVIYADIPDVLLQYESHIKVFVYKKDGDKAYTEKEWVIDVLYRPKPDTYIQEKIKNVNEVAY